MIKIVRVSVVRPGVLHVGFSDDSSGDYDIGPLIARATTLTRRLADPDYFARVFIELGALAWPNGFELSPQAVHRQLKERGVLKEPARVA